jgi:hypothetical protein
MAISKARARTLCNQREFEFVEKSWGKELNEITAGRLRQKVRHARKLRDKYRDLARQQVGEARGKRSPQSTRPSQGAANTKAKAQLFDEALGRFEERLSQIEGGD